MPAEGCYLVSNTLLIISSLKFYSFVSGTFNSFIDPLVKFDIKKILIILIISASFSNRIPSYKIFCQSPLSLISTSRTNLFSILSLYFIQCLTLFSVISACFYPYQFQFPFSAYFLFVLYLSGRRALVLLHPPCITNVQFVLHSVLPQVFSTLRFLTSSCPIWLQSRNLSHPITAFTICDKILTLIPSTLWIVGALLYFYDFYLFTYLR